MEAEELQVQDQPWLHSKTMFPKSGSCLSVRGLTSLSLTLSTARRKEKMLHCVPETRNKESACVILLVLLSY